LGVRVGKAIEKDFLFFLQYLEVSIKVNLAHFYCRISICLGEMSDKVPAEKNQLCTFLGGSVSLHFSVKVGDVGVHETKYLALHQTNCFIKSKS
jgi:hypothetical protein